MGKTALHQNVPNPFNPTTAIRFDLGHEGRVVLRIFDVGGRLVRTLLDEKMKRGLRHAVSWNGLDDAGRAVASGVYFYRLETPDALVTRKLVVLR